MTRPLKPSTFYAAGDDAYFDPEHAAEPIRAMFQQRNRVMSAGLDRCPRCDALGHCPQDNGRCTLCGGTGTPGRRRV